MYAPLSAPAGTLREARKLRHTESLLTQMKMDTAYEGSVSCACTKYFTFRIKTSRATRLELRTRQGRARLLVSRCTLPSITDNEWSSGITTSAETLLIEKDDPLFRVGKYYVGVYGLSQEETTLFELEVTQFKIRTPLPLSKSLLRVQSYIKKFNTIQKAFNDEDDVVEEEDRKDPEIRSDDDDDSTASKKLDDDDLFEFREETPRRSKVEEKGKKFADSLEDKWKIEQRRRAMEMKGRLNRFLSAYKSPTKMSKRNRFL